jgi:acetyl esterase/lipase
MSDVTGVTTHLGLEYAEVTGFRPLELDLYLPEGAPGALPEGACGALAEGACGALAEGACGAVPTVVHVHGGGWRRGSRRHPLPALGEDFYQGLASSGLAVAAVDYRLSGEARYPAAVDDVRAAVAWVRAALPGYGITPGPVVLWGDSAGGHLALLAALTGTAVDGVVAWFPVTDLLGLHGPGDDDPASREALFLGAPPSRVPDLARHASPITHVHAGAPPMLVMHGDSDALVPADQSVRFAKALADAGGPVSLELVPGASHFWDGAADVPGIVARSAGFVHSLAFPAV